MAFVIAISCVACGDCRNACPQADAIVPGVIYRIDEKACTDCGTCAEICMTSSIYAQTISIKGDK